jgi:hypothetical protein
MRRKTFMARRFRAVPWRLALVLALCSGCGKEAPPPILPAQGVVLLNGAPLPNAQVRFVPKIGFGSDFIATGVTDDAGHYQLTCHGQEGACAVENTVTVTEAEIPTRLKGEDKQVELIAYMRTLKNRPIPKDYGTLGQTPLKVTVVEGQQDYKLELKR